jgi:hypothetical protein
VPRAQE